MIGVDEKSYTNCSAFTTRVTDLTVRPINEHTNLLVTDQPVMQRRSIKEKEFCLLAKTPPEELERETKKTEFKQR